MELPNSVIGLVGFLTVTYVGSIAWLIKYFMTYIQKKNANLERTSQNFIDHLKHLEASPKKKK